MPSLFDNILQVKHKYEVLLFENNLKLQFPNYWSTKTVQILPNCIQRSCKIQLNLTLHHQGHSFDEDYFNNAGLLSCQIYKNRFLNFSVEYCSQGIQCILYCEGEKNQNTLATSIQTKEITSKLYTYTSLHVVLGKMLLSK